MRIVLAAFAAAVALTACGQQQCGPGTVELRDGTCMGTNQNQQQGEFEDDDFEGDFEDDD